LKNEHFELQRKILFLILSLILIPVTVALLKHYSPIYCPNHIQEFGGGSFYISPLDIFSLDVFLNNHGKCFPAGHASGGFALISLYFVNKRLILRRIILVLTLCLGWIMGMYQIAKGAHFLSDTLVTLAISYMICLILSEYLLKGRIIQEKVN
jgi:membrane-associated PAP2 superfamily phosphatase